MIRRVAVVKIIIRWIAQRAHIKKTKVQVVQQIMCNLLIESPFLN